MFLTDPQNSLNTRKSASGAFVVDDGGDKVGMDIDLRRDGYCPTLYVGTGVGPTFVHVETAAGDDLEVIISAPNTHLPLQVIKVFSDTTCEDITALY
jgi:hypothetical protein